MSPFTASFRDDLRLKKGIKEIVAEKIEIQKLLEKDYAEAVKCVEKHIDDVDEAKQKLVRTQKTAAEEDAKYRKIFTDQSVKHHARVTILKQKIHASEFKLSKVKDNGKRMEAELNDFLNKHKNA